MKKSMNTLRSTMVALSAVGALTACGSNSVEGQPHSVPEASRTTEAITPTTTPPPAPSPIIPTSFPREDKICTRMPELDDSRRGPKGVTILTFAKDTTCEMTVRDSADQASAEIGKMDKNTLFTLNCYKSIGDVMLHNTALQIRFNTPDNSGSYYGWVNDNADAWVMTRPANEAVPDCGQTNWDPNEIQPLLVVTGSK